MSVDLSDLNREIPRMIVLPITSSELRGWEVDIILVLCIAMLFRPFETY